MATKNTKAVTRAKTLEEHRKRTRAARDKANKVANAQADKDAAVVVEYPDVLPPLPKDRPITDNERRIRQRLIHNHIRDINREAANAAGKAVNDVLQGRKATQDVHSRIARRDAAGDLMTRRALEAAAAQTQGKAK